MENFTVSKFYAYNGPNFYLNSRAFVFNLSIQNESPLHIYEDAVSKHFPEIKKHKLDDVAELFAVTVRDILKMEIGLYIDKYDVTLDGADFVVAVEHLDEKLSKKCVKIVAEWFNKLTNGEEYDFGKVFIQLQSEFDRTLYGGPTIYSLVEAGFRLNIPVYYLFEENQFQWGYGKKQLRGRSTTFHTDGIKDTEFTMFKDMVGDFLEMCGLPTPNGTNCFEEDEIVAEALKIGFPCVVKPVAGHKGNGVTTGINSEEEVRIAFRKIVDSAKAEGVNFDGALVQTQIFGTDHRLLAVGGKFIAALERVPAYVDGDGVNTIGKLIDIENDLEIRLDNARSPLCKIKKDDNLHEFLHLQNLNIDSIPQQGERIVLRRVANISAGGVSINVTDKIHPTNIKLVEDIARFFTVKCLGIDVLAGDISKPWNEGNFGIIEINAGPGVFMHLAPAYGGSIDVPAKILLSHFEKPINSRIPIIAGNFISNELAAMLNGLLHDINPDIYVGALTSDGIWFNHQFFYKNPEHDQNVKIILRNPQVDFAIFQHTRNDIYDFGLLHQGADIVILDEAHPAEEKVLEDQLLPGGLLIIMEKDTCKIFREGRETDRFYFDGEEEKDKKLVRSIERELERLVYKYE
ncbi:MAG: cyanophycin synthetase [Bacteroidetes bacterium HGW-Bacteroidetes-21]|jgi:cyanophycin synthetase|nr:MAG: cyanophycin synthetase [Bacteroidetes bacterium HGW-Bacteroidetes-21]